MTVRTLATIDALEWDLVARMAAASTPSEIETAGVVLVGASDGTRRWRLSDSGVEVEVMGGVGAPTVGVSIPCRVLWFAAELAQIDGQCDLLRDDDGTVILSSDSGTAAVEDRPECKAADYEPSTVVGPFARLAAGRLAHLLHAARRLPDGLELDGSGPPLVLRVSDGTVSALVDWRHFGGRRSQFSVPAETSGSADATPAHAELAALLAHISPDEEITLVLPPTPVDPVAVLGDQWRALVHQLDLTARRWAPILEQVLDGEGLDRHEADAGAYTVLVNDREVLLAIVEHGGGTIRCSTVLAEGVPGTRDVLRELNALTGGLVGIRVWWAGMQVHAGFDLACEHMSDLHAALGSLVRQTYDLGPIVASLAKRNRRYSRKDAA
jgi:hypothetical protein